MKTPKVVMGLLTAAVLTAGYTITQVQAQEHAQNLYTNNVEVAQVNTNTSSSVLTDQLDSDTSTEEIDNSEQTSGQVSHEVTPVDSTAVQAEKDATDENTLAEEEVETPASESVVAEEVTTNDVESDSQTTLDDADTTSEALTSLPDQTENRQIIIDRVGLASDALDGYSDEQIAQSRVEAEKLGSDPGYSYSWLLQQTPANATTQSM
ncbi:hypothetical protein [Aerococcus sp. HMSC10H05]|uniref:hypothetical protein n=1 Tax=Aerococcus sp. HMSC10H05 TaxID=1581084 RepID=UPI0008A33F06|nr:hypothetical protein [Aerococcus sp. HMSC10H05]OFU53436.1 hypothetical protein HMPREF3116_00435 [Aerococcus sp. HMSC10H05]